jgi:hypothetical protein
MTLIAHSPNGSVMFCDDIRFEANGKQIFVGCYTAELIISPAFPAVLPTFAAFIRYTERQSETYLPLKFKIFVPGQADAAYEADVSKEQLEAVPKPKDPEAEDPIIMIGFVAQFRNFVIPSPGFIRVRVYRADDEIKLGSLRVRLSEQPLDAMGMMSAPPTNPKPSRKGPRKKKGVAN